MPSPSLGAGSGRGSRHFASSASKSVPSKSAVAAGAVASACFTNGCDNSVVAASSPVEGMARIPPWTDLVRPTHPQTMRERDCTSENS